MRGPTHGFDKADGSRDKVAAVIRADVSRL
jgi:hypothetical protein